MRTLLILALLATTAHARDRTFTCKDLTTSHVLGWRGTITIEWRSASQKSQYGGHASYTVHFSNDELHGVTVDWPGFTDSWQGETKKGTGEYHASVFGVDIASTGPLLDPATGHWDGLGIDPHDQIQVDTSGCRYAFHAGAAMHYQGDVDRAGLGEATGRNRMDAVGFSGTIPAQSIPASATELTGSVGFAIPGHRFDLLNSFYYTSHVQDLSRASGQATITWKLVPEFERKSVKIEAAALFDIDTTPLRYLSASPCSRSLCGGNPRVNGTLLVTTKSETDALEEIRLDVVERGTVVASGKLAANLRSTLLRPFGPEKKIELPAQQKLFEFTDDELAKIDQNTDARLELRVHVRTKQDAEDDYSAASVPKLVLYTRPNRDTRFPLDADKGGDRWVKPSVRDVYAQMDHYLWSDFSNMNGGSFRPPHASHDGGNDVDGIFDDHSIEHDWATLKHHTAATAQRLLAELNNPTYGSRIICVFLSFNKVASDPFWMAIKDVKLADGRKADGVFLSHPTVGDHETHVHFRVVDIADKHKYPACKAHIVDGVP